MSINLTTKHLFDYVYLAEASYANFNKFFAKPDISKKDAIEQAISYPENQYGRNKPESLAKLVTKNYEVIAQYTDRKNESSFSATLFKGKAEGSNPNQYVLAFKGTDGKKDLLAVDVGEIVITERSSRMILC